MQINLKRNNLFYFASENNSGGDKVNSNESKQDQNKTAPNAHVRKESSKRDTFYVEFAKINAENKSRGVSADEMIGNKREKSHKLKAFKPLTENSNKAAIKVNKTCRNRKITNLIYPMEKYSGNMEERKEKAIKKIGKLSLKKSQTDNFLLNEEENLPPNLDKEHKQEIDSARNKPINMSSNQNLFKFVDDDSIKNLLEAEEANPCSYICEERQGNDDGSKNRNEDVRSTERTREFLPDFG